MLPTNVVMYTSANNGEEILIFPIVPRNLPEIEREFLHEEFVTNNKVLTLIGKESRRKLTFDLLLPVNKSYRSISPNARQNGKDYIDFWEKWSERKVPMRLVITDGINELLNMAYTVDSLTWYYDKKKDIKASLTISEYIFTNTDKPEEEQKQEYKWEEIYIRYKGSGYKMTAANIGGHWLVPVRKVLELVGCTVKWNGNDKSIEYVREGDTIHYKLVTPFEIYEGTAYGYIYMLAEELQLNASWDGEKRTVELT